MPEPAVAEAPEQKAPPAAEPTPPPATDKPAAAPTRATPGKPAARAPSEPAAPAAPPSQEPDIEGLLGKDDFWKHPKVAGRIGDLVRRQTEQQKARWDAEQQEAASRAERERLKKLRQEDPYQYAQLMEAQEEAQEAESKLQKLRTETRGEFARAIGSAFKDLPEWAEVTPDEMKALADAVAGKGDDEAVPAFNLAAVRIVAAKIADKRVASEVEKRVSTEKDAWRAEWEAERLAGEQGPGLARARQTNYSDEPDHIKDPKAWNEWYDRTVKARSQR